MSYSLPLSSGVGGPQSNDTTPLVPEGFDLDCLNDLLTMMGQHASELLHQAIADLGSIRDGLKAADIPQLRQHSHVLVALAGTLGERRLQNLAETVNRDANAGIRPDLAEVETRLSALISYLSSRLAR